jgi:quercetin dioxygenase-like cupin family protein
LIIISASGDNRRWILDGHEVEFFMELLQHVGRDEGGQFGGLFTLKAEHNDDSVFLFVVLPPARRLVTTKCQIASHPTLTQVKEIKKTSRSSFRQKLDLRQCGVPSCKLVCEHMSEKPLIDAGREKVLSLAEETKFVPNGIVSRTLLRTANSRVVLFGFAEGQELTEHTSTQHALVQMLSGECEFSLAGQVHSLKTGDLLYMPPNLAHAAKATTEFSMLLTLTKPELPAPASTSNQKKT